MKVSAKLNNTRIAPRKSKLVADLIKGMDIADALKQLDVHVKKTSLHMKKLLESAIANGENNFGIDRDNMYIFDIIIGSGPTLKRWKPRAFGRAGQILKRTSKIEIILEERVEGKNRKSKEELEKEKNERKKKKEEIIKQQEEKEKEEEKETKKEETKKINDKNEEVKKEGKNKSWTKRMFQRKSM